MSFNKKLLVFFGVVILFTLLSFIFVYLINAQPKRVLKNSFNQLTEYMVGNEPVLVNGSVVVSELASSKKIAEVSFSGSSETGLFVANTNRKIELNSEGVENTENIEINAELFFSSEGKSFIRVENLTELINEVSLKEAKPYTKDGAIILAPIAKKYSDRWISFSTTELEESGLSTSLKGSDCGFTESKLEEYIKATENINENDKFLTVEKYEKKNDFYFKLNVDQKKLKEHIASVRLTSSSCPYGEIFDHISNVELWADKVSHKPKKITMYFNEEKYRTVLNVEFNNKKPVNQLVQPKEATTLEEFKAELESIIGTSVDLLPTR